MINARLSDQAGVFISRIRRVGRLSPPVSAAALRVRSLEVALQESHVGAVGFPEHVDDGADERDGAKHSVAGGIDRHPRHCPLAGAEAVTLRQQVSGHAEAGEVTDARDKAEDGIEAEPDPEHAELGVEQVREVVQMLDVRLCGILPTAGRAAHRDGACHDALPFEHSMCDEPRRFLLYWNPRAQRDGVEQRRGASLTGGPPCGEVARRQRPPHRRR